MNRVMGVGIEIGRGRQNEYNSNLTNKVTWCLEWCKFCESQISVEEINVN